MRSITLLTLSFFFFQLYLLSWGFPGCKESAFNVEDPGSIPGLGRSPREGNGNPLQFSYMENLMNRGAWWTTVRGVGKSWALLRD